MEKEKPIPLKISDEALRRIYAIMEKKNIPSDYGLRVGIKGGGCGGTTYLLAFDKPKSADEIYTLNGLTVLVDKKHFLYVFETLIDYEETEEEKGFVFRKSMA